MISQLWNRNANDEVPHKCFEVRNYRWLREQEPHGRSSIAGDILGTDTKEYVLEMSFKRVLLLLEFSSYQPVRDYRSYICHLLKRTALPFCSIHKYLDFEVFQNDKFSFRLRFLVKFLSLSRANRRLWRRSTVTLKRCKIVTFVAQVSRISGPRGKVRRRKEEENWILEYEFFPRCWTHSFEGPARNARCSWANITKSSWKWFVPVSRCSPLFQWFRVYVLNE